ncbi:MAG: SPOR domain-containing protein [Azovibrio sp.]|nr:SPOR domain-containing protein [Azovibrio sp.]
MIDPDDVQLQIKKKARRRLVGAVAFASFAALVLPMVMDQEPAPPAQEVEIRIPGQDDKPFQPHWGGVPVPQEAPAPASEPAVSAAPPAVTLPKEAAAAATATAPAGKSEATPQNVARVLDAVPTSAVPPKSQPEKPAPETKPTLPEVKPEPKPAPKPEHKVAKVDEAERAAAILAGKSAEPAATGGTGAYVILIGAFANEANVKNIKTKLGELGIKVYTEPLDSPQGRKTRVRAGPFQSREAAERALEKMKRIGVSGVVAAK